MADQQLTKPNADTYSLEDIVNEVLDGGVRIPEFQRVFRWQWEDVRRLFDSIVRGYPIGSLLLWARQAPAATLQLGALKINAPAKGEALWVVDGQQRLTSLASALDDAGMQDPRFAICYDLPSEAFIKPTQDRLHTLPLPVIFDLQRLLKWFMEHPESSQYFDEARRVAKAILQYTIPAYIVKQEDELVLRDIFDRMNNYGKRLTRAEVFSALHAGGDQEGRQRTLSDIAEHIEAVYGFGSLNDDTVLQAILARRGPDVTREIRIEFSPERASREFSEETPEQAYRAGEEALSRAVAFLQEDAGVPHFCFLTYRYLLIVLVRFFGHHPEPAQRNRELLRRWFWRASMVGPGVFSGWPQAMRSLATQIKPYEEVESETKSVQALLNAVSEFPLESPRIARFHGTSASSRMLLCALWSLEPRSVINGESYSRSQVASALAGRRTAVDIVYPILRRELDGVRVLSANRYILLGDDYEEDARAIFAKPSLFLSGEAWEKVLESHCLNPELSDLLNKGQNSEFLSKRQALMTEVMGKFLASMTEHQFEDTPPLEMLDFDDEDEESEDLSNA